MAENEELVFINSEKGKKVLIIGPNKYYFNVKNKSGTTNWRCYKTTECSASVTLSADKILRKRVHACLSDAFEVQQRKNEQFMQICKNKVCESMAPVQQIFESELLNQSDVSESSTSNLFTPEFSACKSTLYRTKYRYLDVSKSKFKNIDEIEIPKVFADDFLIYDGTKSDKILVFATPLAVDSLKTIDSIFCDGTFKVTPKPFYQLYSCHANFVENEEENRIVPLIYGLLPDKTQATYFRFFTILKENLGLSIKKLKCDFEVATINAAKMVYPNLKISGCYYHYQKALWAKAGELSIDTTTEEKKIIQSYCMLALLPAQFIAEGHIGIVSDIPDNHSNLVNFTKFDDYFLKFWIKRITADVFSCADDSYRTNNSVEGWHHRLNVKINRNPSLYLFIKALRNEAAFQDRRIQQSEINMPAKKRRAYDIKINLQIKKTIQDCTTEKINVKECIKRLTLIN